MSLGEQILPSAMRELCAAMREARCFYTSSSADRAAPPNGPRPTNDDLSAPLPEIGYPKQWEKYDYS